MDKRTRVLNALNQKPVDHVPVGFWIHFFDAGVIGEPCIQAHRDYYNKLDLDFIKVMSDGYFGFPVEGEIRTVEDLKKYKRIDKDHPWIRAQIERAKAIVDEFGKDRCIFFNIFAPFASIKNGFNIDYTEIDTVAMDLAKNHTTEFKEALDIVADGNSLLAKLLIEEAGCDGIYFCVSNGEFDRFTEEEYKNIVAPSELYVLEHINRYSENNIMHCCGFMGSENRVSLWFDYPIKCVNWATHVENIDLNTGRYLFHNKTVLGGFDTHWGMGSTAEQRGILYHGSKEELQEYTRNLVLNSGKIGTLIGGDCTMDHRMDLNRVNWIIEAVRSI